MSDDLVKRANEAAAALAVYGSDDDQKVADLLFNLRVRIEALTAKLAQATWLLTEAAVQLEEGKIKTRRNRAAIIWNLLDEMKDDDAP